MGVWSLPLCIYAIGCDADGILLDFENCDPLIHLLEQHGIITRGQQITLKKSFMNMCNSAKVYGYFDQTKCAAWAKYLKLCFEQNPNLQLLELHMYCGDDDIPFYITANRDGCQDMMELYEFPPGNILYSQISTKDEEEIVMFDKEMYIDRVTTKRGSLSYFETLLICTLKGDRWYTLNALKELPHH
jgi:hypothetical protein